MKPWTFFTLICLTAACGDGEVINADNADAGDSDATNAATADAEIDTAIPDPPRALAPCEATQCRDASLGGPPCASFTTDDTFSNDAYPVHAYRSMVWDGAQTEIRVDAMGGDWTPVIVLARLNGEILFDGDVGAVRPPFDVHANGPADVFVSTAQATGIVVYVTSKDALDSNFESAVPTDASYTLSIGSDCGGGERFRCVVNGRDTGEPECGWLHYVGRRVVSRLEGARDQRLSTAARVAWWSLKEGLLALDNPIGKSVCGGEDVEPLATCSAGSWTVGLTGVEVGTRDVAQLEELASRLYSGAMPDGVLRTTANEAGLNREDAAAVMEATDALRASWLLRNSSVGFTLQEQYVTSTCVDGSEPQCYGAGWEATRLYAADRAAALRSIDDLQSLFDQMAE